MTEEGREGVCDRARAVRAAAQPFTDATFEEG